MMETKQCTKCGEVKPLEAFGKRKASKDGLRSECRRCQAAYDNANKGRKAAYMKAWCEANKERKAAYDKAYKTANRERELARVKDWLEANRPRRRANVRAREAGLATATPMWADRDAIAAIYAEAERLTRETGIPHHVDHIVPLKGKGVCGLHVPWNLRAIPAAENLSKSNKLMEHV